MIQGNIDGIRKSILERIENLYDISIDKYSIFSYELVDEMNDISRIIRKEISVAIDRKGKILSVIVGDSRSAQMPFIEDKGKRLSGIRIIHTHPSGNPKLSSLDISALLDMKLDAMVSIGVKENTGDARVNIGLCDVYDKILICSELKNLSIKQAIDFHFMDKVGYIDKIITEIEVSEEGIERAILVSTDSEESLEELQGLAEACEVLPVYKVFQKKNRIDSAYYTGQGKAQELKYLRQIKNANLVVFDDELSGSQVRNLEERIGCKVIDRTTLILEIFAKRAKSKQAKLQVELAILKHRLSRLRGFGADLDKIKGGVGTKGGVGSRGPGEKKLETDRRHIEKRIQDIKEELLRIASNRAVQRENRNKGSISKVALVGYTNAGKSTLRNKLCEISSCNNKLKNEVFEADMLFATLDTTVRAVVLNDNRKIALSDTVGFISKLPHELVEAFKSTLEEVIEADVLLHVVDASSEEALEQIKAVNDVLGELNVLHKNIIVILNKIDKVSIANLESLRSFLKDQKVEEVSAITGKNLNLLLKTIGEEIPVKLIQKEFIIPYHEQAMVSMLHENCNIVNEDYREEGAYIKAQVYEEIYERCKKFEV
ncbi:GTPase HflX [Clostridium sp. KNHs214]|uniref:GTPase HflX n=1 Tax=Clostridium sp. KNHs214 TaxID=1540257 RepID=UPI000556CFBE|nr:GTPase HflX [Clostridium sp. KNHs214]